MADFVVAAGVGERMGKELVEIVISRNPAERISQHRFGGREGSETDSAEAWAAAASMRGSTGGRRSLTAVLFLPGALVSVNNDNSERSVGDQS